VWLIGYTAGCDLGSDLNRSGVPETRWLESSICATYMMGHFELGGGTPGKWLEEATVVETIAPFEGSNIDGQ
jgi:hypothetical protein